MILALAVWQVIKISFMEEEKSTFKIDEKNPQNLDRIGRKNSHDSTIKNLLIQ